MIVYWLLFSYFAIGSLITRKLTPLNKSPLLLFGLIITCVLIGFRYKVGGDWYTYEYFFTFRGGGMRAPPPEDPAYEFINWLIQQTPFEIWAVNLICALVFTWGLARFCLAQPQPWLSLLVAIPYMVIVVAMGYTRQAVALGILMAGLATVSKGASAVRFSIYTAGAALFHRTAVMMLPIVALGSGRNRTVNVLVGIACMVLLYDIFLGNGLDRFIHNYINAEYASSGAGIRLTMNFIAAAILLLANRRLQFNEIEWRVWRNFAWASIVLLLALFITPSSTAIDRMSIYVMPLQIAVLSRAPLISRPEDRKSVV